jgi:cullin 3
VRLQPVASRVESVSERHKTRSLVEVDRKGELEAAVVRIMKEAKTLHQNALIARVIEQVKHRFAPTPGDIKKSIEGLCSREFLACSDEDRSFFIL